MRAASESNHVSFSLASCLTVAITDFEMHFNRKPQTLTIPCWRYDELIRSFVLMDTKEYGGSESKFCGIPIRFSPSSDIIELQ